MNSKEHYRVDAEVFDYWAADQNTPAAIRRNQNTFWLAQVQAGESVLDIGSGRGWFSLYAAAHGAAVTALDLSEGNLARICKADSRITTILADASEPLEADSKYDLIVALEVLEHIVNPAAALANWKSLLKPGGRLLITVPFKEQIRYSLCIHCNRKTPQNAHLHSFDKVSLGSLLAASGLKVNRWYLFSHKLLCLLRLESLAQKIPFPIWRQIDKMCGITGDKYNYLAVLCN